jgi:hypothetical protein
MFAPVFNVICACRSLVELRSSAAWSLRAHLPLSYPVDSPLFEIDGITMPAAVIDEIMQLVEDYKGEPVLFQAFELLKTHIASDGAEEPPETEDDTAELVDELAHICSFETGLCDACAERVAKVRFTGFGGILPPFIH